MKRPSTGWYLLTVLPLIPGIIWVLTLTAGVLADVATNLTP